MAERSWQYYGVDLTDADHEDITEYFDGIRTASMESLENELPKDERDVKLINRINFYLSTEFSRLGLPYQPYDAKQFHMVDRDEEPNAYRARTTDYIVINKPAWNEEALPLVFIHEGIRLAQYRLYRFESKDQIAREEKGGYFINNPHEDSHEHFYGFDSVVVQKMSREIFLNNIDEISGIWGINLINHLDKVFALSYTQDLEILEEITDKVSHNNNLSKSEVGDNFKKGLFTGNLFYLREIERTFGIGTLRVLGAWDCAMKRISDAEMDEKMLSFLTVRTIKQRNKIAREVLNERERFRYNTRVKGEGDKSKRGFASMDSPTQRIKPVWVRRGSDPRPSP